MVEISWRLLSLPIMCELWLFAVQLTINSLKAKISIRRRQRNRSQVKQKWIPEEWEKIWSTIDSIKNGIARVKSEGKEGFAGNKLDKLSGAV